MVGIFGFRRNVPDIKKTQIAATLSAEVRLVCSTVTLSQLTSTWPSRKTWLFRDMLYSTKSTIFSKTCCFQLLTRCLRGPDEMVSRDRFGPRIVVFSPPPALNRLKNEKRPWHIDCHHVVTPTQNPQLLSLQRNVLCCSVASPQLCCWRCRCFDVGRRSSLPSAVRRKGTTHVVKKPLRRGWICYLPLHHSSWQSNQVLNCSASRDVKKKGEVEKAMLHFYHATTGAEKYTSFLNNDYC